VEEARLVILRLLNENPAISQRQLAERLGTSLGKTHYLLHALLDAGMVKVRRFRQSDRKLAYAYVLTPRGLKERVQLAAAFLARKERQFEVLKKTIEMLRNEVGDLGRPVRE
jgi:EPS-associated MarR family transcriptional regulator